MDNSEKANLKEASCHQAKDVCFVSSFAFAVLLYWLVNYAAWVNGFGQTEATKFPEKNWTSWAIGDFLKQKKSPDLVFLGSSLMLVPLAGCDADYTHKRIDGSQHHKSLYFEDVFSRKSGKAISTFNFALPGEMPSDADLITQFLLRHEKAPKIIVYGVGPRDFLDNLLPSPSATDPFHSLSRLGSVEEQASLFFPDWKERLNYELSKSVYLYGLKQDITCKANQLATSKAEKYIPLPQTEKRFSIFDRRALMPEYRPGELNVGEAFFRPHELGEREAFADNLIEYRKRYKSLKWDTYITQMRSFTDLMNVARARGIHVVVMAMPITDINRSLLTKQAWDVYRTGVRSFALSKGATFIDLDASKKFALSDFMDTVHLHTGGGRKMLDCLADTLSADRPTLVALGIKPKGVQLASGLRHATAARSPKVIKAARSKARETRLSLSGNKPL